MVNQQHRRVPTNIKLLLDFGPLAAFFVGYQCGGIVWGTGLLVAATLSSLVATYILERRVALAPLISGVLVTGFGVLTILLHDERFIKIKPTIINLLFAVILLVGAYGFKRGLLRHVLDMAIQLTDEGWVALSRRWGFFFLFLALLNEVIWRSFSTDFWVNFKVFGMFTLTMLFAVAQVKFVERFQVK